MRHLKGDEFEVFSAGTNPTTLNPRAIKVMAEIGIDISGQTSKSVQEFLNEDFDYIITVCDDARESCPVFSGGKHYIHWNLLDPAKAKGSEEEVLAVFRKVRDEIKLLIEKEFKK